VLEIDPRAIYCQFSKGFDLIPGKITMLFVSSLDAVVAVDLRGNDGKIFQSYHDDVLHHLGHPLGH
jgi:hypothetical protein